MVRVPGTSGTERSPQKYENTSDEQLLTSQFDIVEPKPHVTMRARKQSRPKESGDDAETWREKIKEEKEEDDFF